MGKIKDIISVRMNDGTTEDFERTVISVEEQRRLDSLDDVADGIIIKDHVDLGGGVDHFSLQISRHAVERVRERWLKSLTPRERDAVRTLGFEPNEYDVLSDVKKLLANPEVAVRLLFETRLDGRVILLDTRRSSTLRLPLSLVIGDQVIGVVSALPPDPEVEPDDILIVVDEKDHASFEILDKYGRSPHFSLKRKRKNAK